MVSAEWRDLKCLVEEDGPLDYGLAADYIRQAAEALVYYHQSGFVHRDIKPANLAVNSQGVVKLLDFGLASIVLGKSPSPNIASAEIAMTAADYLAPEQAVNSMGVDTRADIYSLGCTLYYLLTGHPPFAGGTLPQRIHAHQTQSPPSVFKDRPDAPADLVDVCTRMMAKSPQARFQTAKEVASALSQEFGPDHG